MRWIWDPDKNELNRRKHGVSFEAAEKVFNRLADYEFGRIIGIAFQLNLDIAESI